MESLEWQDSWSVGNETLDTDHKQLVQIINRVSHLQDSGEDAVWVLNDLKGYSKYHFDREEKLMEAANIPGLVAHKKKHAMFVEWLGSLQRTINLPEAHFVVFNVANDYLRDWLKNHILHTDMEYKGKI